MVDELPRILVVGSDAWCGLVSTPLRAAGHDIACSHDALTAAEIALGSLPHAIVTQCTLDGASGAQLCRLVMAELPLGDVPVVVMSPPGELGAAFQARAAGAVAHVDSIEGLLEVLPGILARPRQVSSARRLDRKGLEGRLAVVLDRALRDGELGAEVRALVSIGGLEKMFAALVDLASQVLPYTWLGLVVSGEGPSFFLHADEDDQDAEREAREVLALDRRTPCIGPRRPVPRPTSAADRAREPFEVPIFFGDSQVGQLAITLPISHDGDVKRSVGLLAHELGAPIKLISQLEQGQRQVATDALTGLMSRRAFRDEVAREQVCSAESRQPTSFLVVDLDHFKQVNDLHGDPVGDAVLRGVGRAFARALRIGDLACRWGGEEFVVALPNTHLDDALVVAERIRAQIEATAHELELGGLLVVTASIGVAGGATHWFIDQMLAAANAALHEAKAMGRNRVCTAPSQDPVTDEMLDDLFMQAS